MLVASRNVVRAQEMSEGYKSRWLEARAISRDKAIALKDWTMWFDSLSGTAMILVRYGVLAAGASLALSGAATIGAMVAATFLVTRVLTPVERFMGELPNILEASRNWGRLNRILSEQGDLSAITVQAAGSGRVRLSLDNVAVRSPVTGALILKGVTLDVAPGSMVQINGSSGRGKTVLAQVVLGLWRRVSGTILIDGINVERLADTQTARIFGYVPETPSFVAGTLAENIAHLDAEPDPDKLVAAAKQACLHAFISALPDGYQTVIDANALMLSRGQRHQLALARAVYRMPDILILDEPDAILLESLPETMDKTFGQILKRGGVILALSRKPLAIRQISASYRLEAGKLKLVKPAETVPASKPKLAVLSEPGIAAPLSAKRG
jgi:ATP-binding cassette subfamily C protein